MSEHPMAPGPVVPGPVVPGPAVPPGAAIRTAIRVRPRSTAAIAMASFLGLVAFAWPFVVAPGAFSSADDIRDQVAAVTGIVSAIPTSVMPSRVDRSVDDLAARIAKLETVEDGLAFLQELTPDDRERLAKSDTPLAAFADVRTPDEAIERLNALPVEKRMQNALAARVKVMAQLDIAEKRMPQDGSFVVYIDGRAVDVRAAVLPTKHGEQVVLRLLQREQKLELPQLGMSPEMEGVFLRAIEQPYGAVFTCGPTGSGKTTTLYAALSKINRPDLNIMTIDDPVEYQLMGISQTAVNPKIELTFASGLRSIAHGMPGPASLIIAAATVLCVGVLDWPLIAVVLCLGPLSIGLAWLQSKR